MTGSTELCARIKAECRRQNRTLRSVMKEAGLGLSTFYMWKGTAKEPKLDSLAGVATALKVKVDDLVAGIDFSSARPSKSPAPPVGPTAKRDDEYVFIGISRRAATALTPFFLRADPGFFELPSDLSRSLAVILHLDQHRHPRRT